MEWSKVKSVGVVVAVLLLAAVGTIVFLLATAPRRASRLLDGTWVVLEKVSFGTTYSSPQPLLDRLLRHLPASWFGRINYNLCSARAGTADREIFTFWLKFSSPAAGTQPISYAIADGSGFEAPMIFTGFYGPYQPAGFGRKRIGLVRGAGLFPRCSKNISLRLYQPDSRGSLVRVAEFPIRNLGFTNSPAWKPLPLPIVQQTNGLTLMLVRAQVGTPCPGSLRAPFALQAGQWSELRFRVIEEGKPAAGWTIKEMWMSDGISKPIRVSGEDNGSFNGQFCRAEGEDIVCVHRWDFWTDEPAWKLRVHFEHPGKPGCWVEYLVRPEFPSSTAANRPS